MLLSNQLRAKAQIWFKVVLKFIRATLPHSLKWKRLQATVFIRRGDTKQTPRRMDEFVPKAALLLARCCWLSNNQSYLGHQRWRAESPTLARALVDNPSGGLKNRTAPTRVEKKKKKASQMKPFILHICPPVADARIEVASGCWWSAMTQVLGNK